MTTWIIGYLVTIIISSILHFIAYYQATGCKVNIKNTEIFIRSENIKSKYKLLQFLLSPDYFLAFKIKKNKPLESNKIYLSRFIQYSNIYNIILSGTILLLTGVFIGFYKNSIVPVTLIKAIVIRVISRSFEIIFAFYIDVVETEKKKSNLKPGERINLAVKSYFEIIIMYATIYNFMDYKRDKSILVFLKNIITSIGISTFTNININIKEITLIADLKEPIMVILQIFTTMSLIYFALAKYIGDKEKSR